MFAREALDTCTFWRSCNSCCGESCAAFMECHQGRWLALFSRHAYQLPGRDLGTPQEEGSLEGRGSFLKCSPLPGHTKSCLGLQEVLSTLRWQPQLFR